MADYVEQEVGYVQQGNIIVFIVSYKEVLQLYTATRKRSQLSTPPLSGIMITTF